ncbi:xyloglucan galactosyltransferase KATAMARI1-like [Pyrus ussuriensis x Pyrus communis]|uniref:Xyloglucan galactosyltransferase KATAMARI1-like n=1 Tax=Pyrus ussuriensis x Pyrus communis TaxID=2448454 RepID=A0A5N5FAD6_9ROSA|nr:xyloglucan galactosyltransferase KATAMARI1-like [Pyrus ussuriensis x Pyrus communis]
MPLLESLTSSCPASGSGDRVKYPAMVKSRSDSKRLTTTRIGEESLLLKIVDLVVKEVSKLVSSAVAMSVLLAKNEGTT